MPALQYLVQFPGGGAAFVDMQHHMIVIAHYRVSADIQGEYAGQLQQFVFDPLAAVFKALAGTFVPFTQKGAAYAPGDTVVVGSGIEGYQGFARESDGCLAIQLYV